MNLVVVLKLIRDGVNKLDAMGCLLVDGSVSIRPEQIAELALYIEKQLEAYGIDVPDHVEFITSILPSLIPLTRK